MTTIQSLKTFLTAPVSECKFSQLNTLIHGQNIRLDITFWGERVITVQGEEDSVSLNALAEKVVSIIRIRCPSVWPSNTTPDKLEAQSVVDHLYKCYRDTDTLIASKNYFTWILAKIRDLRTSRIETRADIEYLHEWPFEVGYKIPRWSWFWGHDSIRRRGDHKSAEELETLRIWSISLGEVVDPVIDKCGHTFEREKIKEWLQENNTCPISRERITIEDLIPNRVVKQAIDILNKRGRAENGSIAVANEQERAIMLRAVEQLRPKTMGCQVVQCQ